MLSVKGGGVLSPVPGNAKLHLSAALVVRPLKWKPQIIGNDSMVTTFAMGKTP